ncbi:unnamed protein product [Lepeophtheirus salmonis]|uniref:(salmon louse) hypothetical protein n=1 Tax=Lepeophtheirus salmonis TaxID=72036 RepID=A0A7R8HDG3_LEPSM|nr:unnamed protein product [Lepeophtheirus salmonis]CAF3025883.1 unnamed protein product [Lepeophtheirus salmonis]
MIDNIDDPVDEDVTQVVDDSNINSRTNKNAMRESKHTCSKGFAHKSVFSMNHSDTVIPDFEAPKCNDSDELKDSLQYFGSFFDDNILTQIVYHSNLYSIQKTNKQINL